jgi:hypothetical protein
MTVLRLAKDQLFSRPPEDHFEDFGSLSATARDQKRRCATVDAKDTTVLFLPDGDSVQFGDAALRLNHYALAQLASMARVPMPLLERLDTETRVRVLNETFPRNRRYRTALVDGDRLRCLTSDRYERVWDADILEEIERWLLPSGFIPAMPTINTDEKGTNLLGNTKPALFRSDRDSFAFFYGDKSPGDDGFGGLRKGIVVFNSEVGAKSFGFQTFYFREMCANFLIWDATGMKARSARHTGAVRGVVREFREDLQEIGAVLTTGELDAFEVARTMRFVPEGPSERDQAVQRLVREFRLPEADAMEVADLVRAPENPGTFTYWGVANGITSASKSLAYAGDRSDMSEVAGRVLSMALALS